MIRPSSPFLSLWRFRFKNTVIIFIIASCMVVLLYANLLVQSFDISGKKISQFFEKTTILSFSSATPISRKVQIRNQVQRVDPNALIIEGQEQPIAFQGLAVEIFSYVSFMAEKDYADFLAIQEWTLIEGRLPEDGTNEIALTQDIMKNRGYEIGDQIGNRVDPTDYLTGSFTVVGVLDGNDSNGGLGNFIPSTERVSNAFFVKLSDQSDSNQLAIQEIGSEFEEVLVLDTAFYESRFARSIEQLTAFLWSLNIVVAVAISISLSLFVYIMYNGRSKEFGAFLALGYTKGWLRRRLIVENLIISVIAYILGLRFNTLLTRIINNVLVEPRGLSLFPTSFFPFFNNQNLLFSAVLPLSFLLASYILSHVFINRLNLLKIINSQ